jgi:hypothetical protein
MFEIIDSATGTIIDTAATAHAAMQRAQGTRDSLSPLLDPQRAAAPDVRRGRSLR